MKVTYEETSKLMLSDNYKDRFMAEYYQLRIRINKLEKFITKNYKSLETLTTPLGVYAMQLEAMQKYKTILEARAAIEGIEIEKEVYNLVFEEDVYK